jgi:alpha-ketoglutarate-dependent taurine dioxygenase
LADFIISFFVRLKAYLQALNRNYGFNLKVNNLSVSPFLLTNEQEYLNWRKTKLENYPNCSHEPVIVDIACGDLSNAEYKQLIDLCSKNNFVIYHLNNSQQGDKDFVRKLGNKVGLHHLDNNLCADNDSITSLQVVDSGRHTGYIPYTNRRLSWHTDGYYNVPSQQIRGFLMHCVQPAAQGGENLLLDHEIAYIQMRDKNPDYIKVLMNDAVMTIPPNIEKGVEIRGEETGPVYSIDDNGYLHMRFSARTRNIKWFDDEITIEALSYLNSLLSDNNPYVFRYRLRAGDGIICNNVLHCRTGFEDGEQLGAGRLLYRARYFDRVSSEY